MPMPILFSQALTHGWRRMTEPVEPSRGLQGPADVKFYAAIGLYIAAFVILARDPFFAEQGSFTYRQGMMPLLLAFVIFATFNWEICLFGRPAGANLLAQLFQLLPFSLFVTRLTATPTVEAEPTSLLGKAMETGKSLGKMVFGDVIESLPSWFTELFTNWKIALLLLLILLILCLKSVKQKLAAVLLVLLIQFGTLLASSPKLGWLLLGTILLFGGLSLQFCRYDRMLYYENVLRRLQAAPSLDGFFAAVALRLMRELQENADCGENHFLSLVVSEYSTPEHPLSKAEGQVVASRVLHRLVYEFHLVVISCDQQGLKLTPAPSLFVSDSLLTMLAVWPRVALTVVVALLWLVLPIDGIPDAIPYVGMLDDAFVAIISAITLRNTMQAHDTPAR